MIKLLYMKKNIYFLFALLFLLLSPNTLKAAQAIELKRMDQLIPLLSTLSNRFGTNKVLVVFDIDNTLLTMNQDLGGDAWYHWQKHLSKASSLNVSNNKAGLLDVQYLLYALSDMRAAEKETPELVTYLSSKGHPVIALTARGPQARSATLRELKDAEYDFPTALRCDAPLCNKRGIIRGKDVYKAAKLALGQYKRLISMIGAKPRDVSYGNGVMMVSGQNKGAMLQLLLASQKETFDAIVFIDDNQKNIDNVFNAFKDDPREVIAAKYSFFDEDVQDFLKNKDRQFVSDKSWRQVQDKACDLFKRFCPNKEKKLRIATWNIANLFDKPNETIPRRDTFRKSEDYEELRRVAKILKADVVALQEINSIDAIHAVFPKSDWKAYISGRRQQDIDTKNKESDGIYTGFAVRKEITSKKVADIKSLSIEHVGPDGKNRPTRWGVDLELKHEGKIFRFLSVHMKSRCTSFALDRDDNGRNGFQPLEHPASPHCTTLAKQVGALDNWIDARETEKVNFAIMGDFNRAFDVQGKWDHFWYGIDDRKPNKSRLWRYPYKKPAKCWDKSPRDYRVNPIDFIILNDDAKKLVKPNSVNWVTFDPLKSDRKKLLSDHCPVYLDLNW